MVVGGVSEPVAVGKLEDPAGLSSMFMSLSKLDIFRQEKIDFSLKND
jgi:hypothetical protein